MSESYVLALADDWIHKTPPAQAAEGKGHLGY